MLELKLDVSDYEPLAFDMSIDQKERLKWRCLRCKGLFAKEYQLMLHLAHFHYFESLVSMKQRCAEFKEKKHYACSLKNCKEVFKNSKTLVSHEQLQHRALQRHHGKMMMSLCDKFLNTEYVFN